jgi:hypothetical protein
MQWRRGKSNMANKWEYLRTQLPKFEDSATPEWRDKVRQRASELSATMSNSEIGTLKFDLRRKKQEFEEQISQLTIDIEACDQILTEWFQQEGITSFRLKSGDTIFQGVDIYPKVEDEAELNDWLDATGQDELRKIHFKTLQAIVKKRLEEGDAEPPGVKAYIKDTIRVRSANNKS